MTILDARLSRPLEGGPSFSLSNRLFRLVWRLAWKVLAAWTPPPFGGWRRLVLRAFGARLAPTARVQASARIWYPPHLVMHDYALIGPKVDCYNIAPVEIGSCTVVSQGASLCTGSHDLHSPHFQLIARPIVLGDQAWIAAGAFVGPGVRVEHGAVLGACAVAFRDLAAWTVYRGNPAEAVKMRRLNEESAPDAASLPPRWNFSLLPRL